jgi:hypothetical protein
MRLLVSQLSVSVDLLVGGRGIIEDFQSQRHRWVQWFVMDIAGRHDCKGT